MLLLGMEAAKPSGHWICLGSSQPRRRGSCSQHGMTTRWGEGGGNVLGEGLGQRGPIPRVEIHHSHSLHTVGTQSVPNRWMKKERGTMKGMSGNWLPGNRWMSGQMGKVQVNGSTSDSGQMAAFTQMFVLPPIFMCCNLITKAIMLAGD